VASPPPPSTVEQSLTQALDLAEEAQRQGARARTAQDWDQVVATWAAAIQALQQVPTDQPERVFAQRQGQAYSNQLAIAQQQATLAHRPRFFPSLGSQVLDEQIGLYLSYIAAFGPPDVLVLGSSRALQGIDPQVLQRALADQGHPQLRVYTFGVNGATAQMVSFVLRQLLTPEQWPKLLLWGGGSRAFNSGRVDVTFASVLASPGYQAVQGGKRPRFNYGERSGEDGSAGAVGAPATAMPVSSLNGYGFLPVTTTFDPATYYQRYPRVSGQYDSTYQPFTLDGVQTLSFRAIAAFARSHDLPLIFVNLPLSSDYLDETRLQYERQFQRYLRREASLGDFTVVDLLEQWRGQNQFFDDPSHLNGRGAERLAQQLAALPQIPWESLVPDPDASEETD
jgi:hypothetical protein